MTSISNTSPQAPRVGVLGGGQLARMLIEGARTLGLEPVLFTAHAQDPAAQISKKVIFGQASDAESLRRFFSEVDHVVFESEFIDCKALENAAGAQAPHFAPELDIMGLLQDKLEQKKKLSKLAIDTAPFKEVSTRAEFIDAIRTFGGQCVLKWARNGYDGKGTFFAKEEQVESAMQFCEQAFDRGARVYAEKKITFVREVALIACRSQSGEFIHYPLVVSEQKNGICHRVFGPALAFGVGQKLEEHAAWAARKLGLELGIVGAYGIEFFETEDGQLLVNEIAPRVHNTGHYTQDACETSQFENHWRAVLSLPLGSPKSSPVFAMLNLLGPESMDLNDPDAARIFPELAESIRLHWYGKAEIRAGRKLGHLNTKAQDPSSLPDLLKSLDDWRVKWENVLRERAKN